MTIIMFLLHLGVVARAAKKPLHSKWVVAPDGCRSVFPSQDTDMKYYTDICDPKKKKGDLNKE